MKQFNGPKYQGGWWQIVAAVAPAVIKAISGSIGSKTQAKAAEQAGDYTLQAAQETIAEQKRQYDLSRSDVAPWMQAGSTALSAQQQMLFGAPSQPSGPIATEGLQPGATAYQGPQPGATPYRAGTTPEPYYGIPSGESYSYFNPPGEFEGRPGGRPLGQRRIEPGARAEPGGGLSQPPPARTPVTLEGAYDVSSNLPSSEFMGTDLPARDYADFAGPAARTGPGSLAIPGQANLPGTVGAPTLGGVPGPTDLGGAAQLPDVYGRTTLPDVLGAPDISTDVGVTGPEFVDPDTSYEAYQDSPQFKAMTFRQQELIRAQAAGRSAQGNLYSGAAGKELQRYGANIAQQGYGDFFQQATGTARDRNINEANRYAAAMDISREGYGRETDEFNRLRSLYGDEVARSMTQYGMGQDIYGAEADRARYGYESDQERLRAQDEINRRAREEGRGVATDQYGMERTAYQDVYGKEMDLYGMDQRTYDQRLAEQNRQFDIGGILYGEQYGAAEDVRGRGIQDYGLDYAAAGDVYGMRRGEYEDYYSKLTGMSGTGGNAASNLAGIGAQTAANIGNVRTGAGISQAYAGLMGADARAAGYMGIGNAVSQGVAGLTDYFANRPPPPTAAQNLYGDYSDVGNYYTG
ncbi:hypothetical protein LCGC14_1434060 [marine sediment metagenome]|uniref:Uncharacterized protein n=1 Tax=marine sediment metagenome TaxID=412755 RepID=A0A0F9M374_9ZZZZ